MVVGVKGGSGQPPPFSRTPARPEPLAASAPRSPRVPRPSPVPGTLALPVSAPPTALAGGWGNTGRAAPLRPASLQPRGAAGRGGHAWFLRTVAQPPGSGLGPGSAARAPRLAKVAQRLFPATEVLFSPTAGGLSFPPPPPGSSRAAL